MSISIYDGKMRPAELEVHLLTITGRTVEPEFEARPSGSEPRLLATKLQPPTSF